MDPPEACPPAYDLHTCPWLDLESPLTAYEVLKLVLLWPLAVVRALWMLVTWLIVGCMSWLICLGVPDDVPLPPLRYGASCPPGFHLVRGPGDEAHPDLSLH